MNFIAGSITTLTFTVPRYDAIEHLRRNYEQAPEVDNEFVQKLRAAAENPRDAILDVINLPDDVREDTARGNDIVQKLEQGLEEIRQSEIEFAQKRLHEVRRQLSISEALGGLGGLGFFEGVAQNLRSIENILDFYDV